jgi:hypothetical protein
MMAKLRHNSLKEGGSMKTAVKVLCIIALVIGVIWAVVAFYGSLYGGAAVATIQGLTGNSTGAASTEDATNKLIVLHFGSFIVVVIAGVLGIIGSAKNSAKKKSIILGLLTLICGIVLLPLNNYIAAVLYVIAGLLLFLAGVTLKVTNQEEISQ